MYMCTIHRGSRSTGEALSIWFFCGILMLAYGLVLLGQAIYEHSASWASSRLHGARKSAPDLLVGCADDRLRRVLYDSVPAEG